jgi:hypothetical protein
MNGLECSTNIIPQPCYNSNIKLPCNAYFGQKEKTQSKLVIPRRRRAVPREQDGNLPPFRRVASSRPVRPASTIVSTVVRKSRLRDFVRDIRSAVQEKGKVATARFCLSPPNPRRGRVLSLRMQVPGAAPAVEVEKVCVCWFQRGLGKGW